VSFAYFVVQTSSSRRPIQHDLAALSGEHGVEAFLEIGVEETVSDHRFDVQAALEHDRHFVPRFIHLAARVWDWSRFG